MGSRSPEADVAMMEQVGNPSWQTGLGQVSAWVFVWFQEA